MYTREKWHFKKPHVRETRHTNVKRDEQMWKETYKCERDKQMWKEPYTRDEQMWKVTCTKREPYERPIKRETNVKRDIQMWKETYKCARDKQMWDARDLWMWKKTHKRDLCICTETRKLLQTCFVGPLVLWKETYTRDKFVWKETCKRDIHMWVEACKRAI